MTASPPHRQPGLGDRPTPWLAVDLAGLERNIAAMATATAANGLDLRPHVKTHKCLEIAQRQLAAGARGVTVATVAEAEIFVAAGFTDVFIAYPLWLDAERSRRLSALTDRARLRIGADSADGVAAAARHLPRAAPGVEIAVEIDSGHHRTGCRPEDAGAIGVAAARAGFTVPGVFTFPGHGYAPGAPSAAAADEADAMTRAARSMAAAGLTTHLRSGGSTPTAALADATALTELRPGVYVFGDAQQLELGRCRLHDIALWAGATVVSRRPGYAVLDAGSKTLGADRPAWTTGFGRLLDHPDARVVALSEHHATVELPPDEPALELGSVVRVAPNHVCTAVNLAADLEILVDGVAVDRWPVAARSANT